MKAMTRTSRRMMLGHMLRFLSHPGNSWVLAGRTCRRVLGRAIRVEKTGGVINRETVSCWRRAVMGLSLSGFEPIERHRRTVLQDYRSQWIHATDRRHPADMSVSDRCQAVSLPHNDGLWLYELIRRHRFSRCLEVGGAFGVGTRYMALALRDNGGGLVTSIEPDEVRHRIAGEGLGDLTPHVRLVWGTAEQVLTDRAAVEPDIDFAFVDALHTCPATVRYFELIRQHVRGPCFCVFHDVNSCWEMAQAWSRITTHRGVTQAASCGRLGFCIVNGTGNGLAGR